MSGVPISDVGDDEANKVVISFGDAIVECSTVLFLLSLRRGLDLPLVDSVTLSMSMKLVVDCAKSRPPFLRGLVPPVALPRLVIFGELVGDEPSDGTFDKPVPILPFSLPDSLSVGLWGLSHGSCGAW